MDAARARGNENAELEILTRALGGMDEPNISNFKRDPDAARLMTRSVLQLRLRSSAFHTVDF